LLLLAAHLKLRGHPTYMPGLASMAPTPVCIGGFAAALYDREHRLPEHVRLLSTSGLDAARAIEELLQTAVSTRSS
jgi:hypothetical protein